MYVLGIIVIGKQKREVRIQPAVVGMAAVAALADGNHGMLLGYPPIVLVTTTIVKRYSSFPSSPLFPRQIPPLLRVTRLVPRFPRALSLVYSGKLRRLRSR